MISTRHGLHLSRLSQCRKDRKGNYLPKYKKEQERMLNGHLECSNLDLQLFVALHAIGMWIPCMSNIMHACIIMHNMIVEDERNGDNGNYDYEEVDNTSTAQVFDSPPPT